MGNKRPERNHSHQPDQTAISPRCVVLDGVELLDDTFPPLYWSAGGMCTMTKFEVDRRGEHHDGSP